MGVWVGVGVGVCDMIAKMAAARYRVLEDSQFRQKFVPERCPVCAYNSRTVV